MAAQVELENDKQAVSILANHKFSKPRPPLSSNTGPSKYVVLYYYLAADNDEVYFILYKCILYNIIYI